MSARPSPFVSVVMPAYNARRFLPLAIASVRAQTLAEWELLVVDDGSTDDSAGLAETVAGRDPRIKVIRGERNQGIAHARNLGLARATARYVAFLDSDDVWLPRKLEAQVAAARATGAGLVCSAVGYLTEDDRQLDCVQGVPALIDYAALLRSTPIVTSTVLVDRERVAGLRFPAVRHEDFACWLGILRGGTIGVHGLQTPLALYRIGGDSASSRWLRSAGWTWRILREQEGLGLLTSAEAFGGYAFSAMRKRAVRAHCRPAAEPWGGYDLVLGLRT